MPYNSQNIATNESCLSISLSYLFKNKMIVKNEIRTGTLSWNNRGVKTGTIEIHTCFTESEKYINLSYSITDRITNEVKNFNYNINLIPVKSNLGIGNVYYFQCPDTFKKCRFLYKAYGSEIFKSRCSYSKRIYYEIQRVSKRYYPMTRVHKLAEILDKIKETRMKHTYKGRQTKTFQRFEKLYIHFLKYERANNNMMLQLLNKYQ